MLSVSEFLERGARRGKERGKHRVRSRFRGPAVELKGWRHGMNKVGVTQALRQSGLSLSEAFATTNRVLDGETVTIRLPAGTNVEALRRRLDALGVVT